MPAAGTEEPGQDLLAEFYAAAQAKATESEKPIPWNGEEGWQKISNQMIRDEFPGLREECKRKGLVVESYLSETWKEIMEALHGPNWRRGLPVSPSSRQKALGSGCWPRRGGRHGRRRAPRFGGSCRGKRKGRRVGAG